MTRNKVFAGFAKMGKTASGWFSGCKLQLIINDKREILAFQLTPGNRSDLSMVDILSKGIPGALYEDKGYISHKLGQKYMNRGLPVVHKLAC